MPAKQTDTCVSILYVLPVPDSNISKPQLTSSAWYSQGINNGDNGITITHSLRASDITVPFIIAGKKINVLLKIRARSKGGLQACLNI